MIRNLVVFGPGKQLPNQAQFVNVLAFLGGEVGNVNDTTIVLVFNSMVASSDFSLGMDLEINAVSEPILSATLQPDPRIVHLVIATSIINTDTVTLTYNSGVGDIHSMLGDYLDSFVDTPIVNNVLSAGAGMAMGVLGLTYA